MDQYEILRELGRGGTSVVYLAADRSDGRIYAMKVLGRGGSEPEILKEAEVQLRAEAEVQLRAEAEGQLRAEVEGKLRAEAAGKLRAEAEVLKALCRNGQGWKPVIPEFLRSGSVSAMKTVTLPGLSWNMWKTGLCSRSWRRGKNTASAKRRKRE